MWLKAEAFVPTDMGREVGQAQGRLHSIEVAAVYEIGREDLMAESVVPPSAYCETISGKSHH